MSYPDLSFEIIPRRSPKLLQEEVEPTVQWIKKYNPSLVDLTFGAGGKPDVNHYKREAVLKTIEVVRKHMPNVDIAVHLTAKALDESSTRAFVRRLAYLKIHNYVLLGGDPIPKDAPQFDPTKCFPGTEALIRGVREEYAIKGRLDRLKVIVGVEPEAPDALIRYRQKAVAGLPAGADPQNIGASVVKGAIAQYSRAPGVVRDFVLDAAKAGLPQVVPGYAPVTALPKPQPMKNYAGEVVMENGAPVMVDRFRVREPQEFLKLFKGLGDNDINAIRAASNSAMENEIKANAALRPRHHFYTHNKPDEFPVIDRLWPGMTAAPEPRGGGPTFGKPPLRAAL